MSSNGHGRVVENLQQPQSAPPLVEPIPQPPLASAPTLRLRSTVIAVALFVLTVVSTLAVGAQYAVGYQNNNVQPALFLEPYLAIATEPSLLLLGVPFSFTLLGILLAHELGHYFACRYYGIAASYPYFLPAPNIIGTFGAFIRIRSRIVNRTALFDVGIAGPIVGFVFAVPALVLAILTSKVVPGAQEASPIAFGNPPLVTLLAAILRPGVPVEDLLLNPVGRAAWVGLFATAINLMPVGQLDGGHILYAVSSERHRRVSLLFVLLLAGLGMLWPGWFMWAAILLVLGFRHPALMDRWEPLDHRRRVWAAVALVIFLLCFMPMPFRFDWSGS